MLSRQRGSRTNPFSRLLAKLQSGKARTRRAFDSSRRYASGLESLEAKALLSALTVSADTSTAGNITLTAPDSANAGDDLTIQAGVTVESIAGVVTLNVGDNFFHSQGASVVADAGIVVNLDLGSADPGTGGIGFLEGSFDAPTFNIHGGDDDDFIGFEPDSYELTDVVIDGGGGALNGIELDLTGVINPSIIYTGATSGTFSSDSHSDIQFTNIHEILIFNNTGTFSEVTLDLSGLPTGGDANPDTIQVDSAAADSVKVTVNTVELFDLDPGDYDALRIIGSSDQDILLLSHATGVVAGAVAFEGGAGADILSVEGNGATSAVYTPSATTPGSGTVDVDGNVVTFSGLAPIDISNMAEARLALPGASDVLTVQNGVDFATGLTDAMRVSGTSGGVAIETVAFFDIDALTIDTSDVDGVDTLTINSADNNHGNAAIAFRTGGDSSDGDGIILAGNITTTETQLFTTAAVTLMTDVVLTTTANGGVRFLDAPINGAHSLTLDAGGVTNLNSAIGDVTPLTAITTFSRGSTTIAQGDITTSGLQTYNAPVTLSVDTFLTAQAIVLNNDLNASPSGFQTLDIDGDFVLGSGADDVVGAANPLGHFTVTGASTFNSPVTAGSSVVTANGDGNSGDQTYAGNVALGTGVDLSVQAVGGGDVTFESNVDGAQALVVTTPDTAIFLGNVGGATALTTVTVNGAATVQGDVATSSTQNWNGDTDVLDSILTGSTVSFAEDVQLSTGSNSTVEIVGDVVIGTAADDQITFDVTGKTIAGFDFDQLVVTGGVTLQGSLDIGGTFAATGAASDTIMLIDNDDTDAVVGIFDGLPNGTVVSLNGEDWRILYNGGDGNDVVLVFGLANVNIGDASVSEGNAGTTTITFDVVLDSPAGGPFRVNYASSQNTADASDFVAVNDTLDFAGVAANETQTITITVNSDEIVELNETFLVSLTSLLDNNNVQLSDDQADGTILNDDAATITINDVTLAEGNSGTTTFSFDVSLDAAVDTAVTLNYATSDDTATTADSDYAAVADMLTFSGTSAETMTIDVLATGDTAPEIDEAFDLLLSALNASGRNVTLARATGVGTITDDDRIAVDLSLDTQGYSGGESTQTETITITATAASAVTGDQTLTVDLSGAGVTATDYTLSSTTITIAAGETVGMVTLDVVDDGLVEATETATIALSNPSSGVRVGSNGSQTLGITDNDTASVAISNASITESDTGTVALVFDVTTSGLIDAGFSVDWTTADGTATAANNDYAADSGQLNFDGSDGQTQTVTVLVTGDEIVELDETFLVNLSNVVATGRNVTISDASADATITNDDAATVSIADVTTSEGNAGQTIFSFTLTLDAATQGAISLSANTADGTATVATADYVAVTNGVVNFSGTAGETQTVDVAVTGDAAVEADETFVVNLSALSAGGMDVTISDVQATGTITNDDTPAVVTLSASTNAGTEAATTIITLTATAASAVVGDQTVDVAVTGVDASDFALSGTTITIADGATTGTITFTVANDDVVELLETATATISNPSIGLTLGATTTQDIAITDNDGAVLTINDVTLAEGDSGTTIFEFTVTLDKAVDAGVSVDFGTADGTATVADSDYAQNSGTLNFVGTAGETMTVQVVVTGDTVTELDEEFRLNLSGVNASGRDVTIADNQGRGDITNDDSATLSINDVSAAEGDSGNTVFTFTVTLDNDVDGSFNVDYATQNGSAMAGDDFTAVSGNTLSFAGTAGETQMLQVIVATDSTAEADESFSVVLSNLVATRGIVTLADPEGVGTIVDDDGIAVALTADTNTAVEADTTIVTLTATAASAVTGDQTIELLVTGLGITTDDYALNTASITIPNGATSGTATFTIQNDALVELTETATVSLVNAPVALSVGAPASQDITITNSTAATLSIADVSTAETDSGDTVMQFTVTLNNAVDNPITVNYATADGTATVANTDYVANNGQLTFAGTAGETQTFDVVVTSDTTVELNETILAGLSGLDAAGRPVTISDAEGEGTIINDDQLSLSISDVSAIETDSGTTFTFTITADNPTDVAYTVDYATADGTATVVDGDYTAITATSIGFTGSANESKTVDVQVAGDVIAELDETFTVVLSNVQSGGRDLVVADDTGTGTIIDDDGVAVTLGVNTAAGDEASQTIITLVATAASPVVGNQTVDVAVTGVGISAEDFALSSATITIADGQTVGTVTLTVQDDSLVEALETATVTISNPSTGVSLGATTTQDIEITSDDTASVSIADVSVNEGNSGTTDLTFTVTLDNAVQGGFTVDYATADDSAKEGSDYVAGNATLTFLGTAGETQTITVTVNGDVNTESDEDLFVNLSNATNGISIADTQAVGTILNDDAASELEIGVDATSGSEADQTQIVITVTASVPVVGDQTVDLVVSGAGITTDDYTLTSTTVTILDGQTTGTATFAVAADGTLEAASETATIALSNPSAGVALGSTASVDVAIQDDTTLMLDVVDRYPGTQPTLTWQPVAGAARYEMWFSRVFPNGQRIFSDTNIAGTSWTPPQTLDSAFYRYWVRAFDAAGNATPWSIPNIFEVRPTLIGPLNGAFIPRPTFEWEPIPFASGYTLFLRSDAGDEVIENIPGTSYTPTADLPAGEVRWWIRASDAIGNRGWTTAALVGVQPQSTVTTPSGNTSDTTPTFNWSPVSGTGRYVLHVINSDTNEIVIREDSLTTTSFTPVVALPEANYRVWVKAIDSATDDFNSGLWSRPVNFTVVVASNLDSEEQDNLAPVLTLLSDRVSLNEELVVAEPAPIEQPNRANRAVRTEKLDVAVEAGSTAHDSPVGVELAMLDSVMGGGADLGWLFE